MRIIFMKKRRKLLIKNKQSIGSKGREGGREREEVGGKEGSKKGVEKEKEDHRLDNGVIIKYINLRD